MPHERPARGVRTYQSAAAGSTDCAGFTQSVSSISLQYTKVRDLRWEQPSPDGPVYLTWGYVQGGDYDQNGVVNIADITPFAQSLGSTWNEDRVVPDNPLENGGPYNLDEYYSMTAVRDGNIDGIVSVIEDPGPGETDDIVVIAQSFLNSIAGYRILGSNATNPANATEVTTAAYADHVDIADPPYSMRLSCRVDASDEEFGKYAYYWVQPYDRVTIPPAQPNYGSYSDSDDVLGEQNPDYDPTDLQPTLPEVPQAVEGIVYGTCETELTLTYIPGDKTPLPITGQTWNFGGAAQGSQTSNAATPTITLASTADDYSATVKVTNAFGDSATTPFTIQTTTDDLPPVVSSVNQSSFTPGGPATFTVIMAQGPKRSCLWDFGGGAWDSGSPPSDTSTEISPTMTLSSTPGYYDAWVEVSNQNNESPDHFEFQVRVGYPPTDVQVIVPGPIAVGEEVVFQAIYSPVSSSPLAFTWDFGLAHPGEMQGPLVAPTMTNGGLYAQIQGNNGTLTITNPIATVTVPFDFRVYWNQIFLEQYEPDDLLTGEAGDYVTVEVLGHDLAYPLRAGLTVYIEYAEDSLAPPSEVDLLDSDNHVVWNLGNVGGLWTASDGWWTPYGTITTMGEIGRWGYFYESQGNPNRSSFEDREETHCSIQTSLVVLPPGYSSPPGQSGNFFNFRIYLPADIGLGPFDYYALLKCYSMLDSTPLTFYIDDELETRTFSNEPELMIHVQGTKE